MRLEFLGLELDTVAMEARLPQEKLEILKEIITEWHSKRKSTLCEFQELIGYLLFVAQVIPCSCTFICRIIDFSMTFTSPRSAHTIPAYACSDINWWLMFSHQWNGVCLITPQRQTLHIFTDTSGADNKGIGGIFNEQWFAS